MAGELYSVIEWARKHGDVSTVSRLRMRVLPLTIKEHIIFDKVDANTSCSSQYLDAVRQAASELVGKEYPR